MKIFLILILLPLSGYINCQTTTLVELGKVGGLHFSLAKSDTINMVGISQNDPFSLRMIGVPESEVAEVVQILNSFAVETGQKPAEQKTITNRTKSLLLTCSYFKSKGWSVMIQHTDPAYDETAKEINEKTSFNVNHFVEIKPNEIPGVVKMFSKAFPAKGV